MDFVKFSDRYNTYFFRKLDILSVAYAKYSSDIYVEYNDNGKKELHLIYENGDDAKRELSFIQQQLIKGG